MEPGDTTPRVARFGAFELDRRSGVLRKDGVRVRLQQQPMRVLEALLDRPGEPVTREALRQRLWPEDTFVDFDNGLNRAINRLRAALGDDADTPRYIETLERRGYRFIAPVTGEKEVAAAESDAARAPRAGTVSGRRLSWLGLAGAAAAVALLLALFLPALRRSATPPERVPIRSLAVLPLANLTGDPAQEYFSDGMTDALITNLASIQALRVISRQSVMRYKGSSRPLPEIARELGVEGVVEGSVARSGGRVRVTAQLIHGPTDGHLWARSYERRLEDVLALQGELARAIAEEIRITVGTAGVARRAAERVVRPDAYDAYLLGRHHWDQRSEASLAKALAYFEEAAGKDPQFALAHAGLAMAHGPRLVLGYVPPGEGLAEQKAAALKALELDAGVGDARAALGVVRTQEWDWDGAEAEFRKAVETDPGSSLGHLWYGWFLFALGRFEESLAQRRLALRLDPLSSPVNRGLARDLEATGRDEEAVAQWGRVLELDPDHPWSHLGLALFHLERARPADGARHLRRASGLMGAGDPATLAYVAIAHAANGDAPEARRLLARLQAESGRRYVSPVLPAFVHAAMDEKDRAFALLEKAGAARDPMLIGLPVGQVGMGLRLPAERLAALRSDPRFEALLRRMGLPRPRASR